jgi:hypothetical protein
LNVCRYDASWVQPKHDASRYDAPRNAAGCLWPAKRTTTTGISSIIIIIIMYTILYAVMYRHILKVKPLKAIKNWKKIPV